MILRAEIDGCCFPGCSQVGRLDWVLGSDHQDGG